MAYIYMVKDDFNTAKKFIGNFSQTNKSLPKDKEIKFLIAEYNLWAFYYAETHNPKLSFEYRMKAVNYFKSNLEILPHRFGVMLIRAAKRAIKAGYSSEAIALFNEARAFYEENVSDNYSNDAEITLYKTFLYYLMGNTELAKIEGKNLDSYSDNAISSKDMQIFKKITQLLVDLSNLSQIDLNQAIDELKTKHLDRISKNFDLLLYFKLLESKIALRNNDLNLYESIIDEINKMIELYPNDFLSFRNHIRNTKTK